MRKIILIIVIGGGGLSAPVILLGLVYFGWALLAWLIIGAVWFIMHFWWLFAVLPVVTLFLLGKMWHPGHLGGISWGILAAMSSTMIMQGTWRIWAGSAMVAPVVPIFTVGVGLALIVYFLWRKK